MAMLDGVTKGVSFVDHFYGDVVVDNNDIIMRHGDPIYDHVRQHEAVCINTGEIQMDLLSVQALFLNENILRRLAEHGLPEAYIDEPTNEVVDAYTNDSAWRMDLQFDPNEEYYDG